MFFFFLKKKETKIQVTCPASENNLSTIPLLFCGSYFENFKRKKKPSTSFRLPATALGHIAMKIGIHTFCGHQPQRHIQEAYLA